MFADLPLRPGDIKDTCWACSMPVYALTPHVTYSGVCFHADCFGRENLGGDLHTDSPADSQAGHEEHDHGRAA